LSLSIRNTQPKYNRVALGADQPGLRRSEMTWLLGLVLIVLSILVEARFGDVERQPFNASPVWGRQPVLGYFVFTPSLVEMLRSGAGLSEAEFQVVRKIAREEVEQLRSLERGSLVIIGNPALRLEDKIAGIDALGYNQKVDAILQESAARLEQALGKAAYRRIVGWVESRWIVERYLHGNLAPTGAARTYRVFATRYDSGGAYTVALPDQCLKFANAGYHVCDDDGYQVGQGYSVFISYEKSTAATVMEAGPWNVDDNYWATTRDPQPRRMFTDLPLGIPEAQAAYFDGYNGGRDQYGRRVTAPFGIDLARQVSIDIGLEPGNNDWIEVSFLWTDGWGKKSSASTQTPGGTQAPLPTREAVILYQTATPGPDGSIIHVVQPGHTLIGISTVYQMELSLLLSQNGLSLNSVIHPGDSLVIQPAQATATPTVETPIAPTPARATSTTRLTRTPRPTQPSSPTPPLPLASPQDRQVGNPEQSAENTAWDPVLVFIAALSAAGVALILAGTALNLRK